MSDARSQAECLICGAPLEYLLEDAGMKCAICGAVERSKTRCVAGCYVCDACHSSGVDAICGVCLAEKSPTRSTAFATIRRGTTNASASVVHFFRKSVKFQRFPRFFRCRDFTGRNDYSSAVGVIFRNPPIKFPPIARLVFLGVVA